jgi:hypothetical protein
MYFGTRTTVCDASTAAKTVGSAAGFSYNVYAGISAVLASWFNRKQLSADRTAGGKAIPPSAARISNFFINDTPVESPA